MEQLALLEMVSRTITEHSLISRGERVLVGFSGGPDSTCLLILLNSLKNNFGLDIHAIYVNHNLRPDEIPGEIIFCRDLCNKLGIPFIQKSVDVIGYAKEHRINKHEAARELRYRAFQEAAFEIGANKIALAHNADDQAETLFMRLARGSGPTGLSGIPVKRGNIIRPLLEIERNEIEAFLEAENSGSVLDSSNIGTDYFRNMIRLNLLPLLKKNNPNIVRTLCNTMKIMRNEERYFDILVTRSLMKLISRKTDNRIELFLMPLEGMDTVILRRVLRRAMQETDGLRGVSFGHIEDMISLIRTGRSGDRINLPGRTRVIKGYSVLVITSEEPVKIEEYILLPPDEIAVRGAGIVIRASFEDSASGFEKNIDSVLLDAELMKQPLKVRPRRPGDFFYPLGFGKRKKLQDFFVDVKVPVDERDSIPLVVSGEDIVWIAGYRADERFRVSEKTKKFLRLGIVKGNF